MDGGLRLKRPFHAFILPFLLKKTKKTLYFFIFFFLQKLATKNIKWRKQQLCPKILLLFWPPALLIFSSCGLLSHRIFSFSLSRGKISLFLGSPKENPKGERLSLSVRFPRIPFFPLLSPTPLFSPFSYFIFGPQGEKWRRKYLAASIVIF